MNILDTQKAEPDLAQVIGQIDAEIAQLRQRTTEAGLNPWVLVGAMVAIVGFLAPLWEATKDFFSAQTGCAFLTAWLVADGLFPLFIRISARRSRRPENMPLRPGRDFADRRPLMFVVLLRQMFLMWLLVVTYQHVSSFLYGGKFGANCPLYIGSVYLLESAQVIWLLWSTRSDKPIRDYVGRGEGTLLFGVPAPQWADPYFYFAKWTTFLNGAWVFFGAALLGLPVSGQPLPATFRAGVLLAALSYLILHYIDILCRPALAERLLAVRLELINREVAPSDALRRIEAIVPRDLSCRLLIA